MLEDLEQLVSMMSRPPSSPSRGRRRAASISSAWHLHVPLLPLLDDVTAASRDVVNDVRTMVATGQLAPRLDQRSDRLMALPVVQGSEEEENRVRQGTRR